MSRLNNRLTLWEQNRLIAPEQKQLILDFESQNKTSHLPYAVFMLGVFVTALGIISLIAANWEEIGGGVKLTADFILLAVLAGGIMRAQNRASAFWRETGIFALFMMTGASIGLIAQVFQTNGTLANGALTWALFSALPFTHFKLTSCIFRCADRFPNAPHSVFMIRSFGVDVN